jgi:hypothetical protein
MRFWNWKFFLLMLAADFLSEVCFAVEKANRSALQADLPTWWGGSGVAGVMTTIIYLINFPLA